MAIVLYCIVCLFTVPRINCSILGCSGGEHEEHAEDERGACAKETYVVTAGSHTVKGGRAWLPS